MVGKKWQPKREASSSLNWWSEVGEQGRKPAVKRHGLPSSKARQLKNSILTFSHSSTNWRLSIQTHEPVGEV